MWSLPRSMGDVIGDINARREMAEELGERGKTKTIQAAVPLAKAILRRSAQLVRRR